MLMYSSHSLTINLLHQPPFLNDCTNYGVPIKDGWWDGMAIDRTGEPEKQQQSCDKWNKQRKQQQEHSDG